MIQYFKFVGYERNGSAFQRADKANKKSQMLEYSSSTKTRRSAVRKYAFSRLCLTYTQISFQLPQGAPQKIVMYSENGEKCWSNSTSIMQLVGGWSQQESVINIFLEWLALCALTSKYARLHMLTPLLFSRYVLTFDRWGVEANVEYSRVAAEVEYIRMITEWDGERGGGWLVG